MDHSVLHYHYSVILRSKHIADDSHNTASYLISEHDLVYSKFAIDYVAWLACSYFLRSSTGKYWNAFVDN